MSILAYFGAFGFFSIGLTLCVLGLLSYHLGEVTRARPLYWGHFLAAILVWVGALLRLLDAADWVSFTNTEQIQGYAFISDALPALGITLGLLVTWYYWSWLLAERD